MPEPTTKHTLQRGSLGRYEANDKGVIDNVIYRTGDLIDLTDEQASKMGDRVEKVSDKGPWGVLDSLTPSEAVEFVTEIGSEEDALEAKEYEGKSKKREVVLEACDKVANKLSKPKTKPKPSKN